MNIKPMVVVAVVGLIAGITFVVIQGQIQPFRQPYRTPPEKPFKSSIAGVGIIEAYRENIKVPPYWSGKIVKVYVEEGDNVKKGDPIYSLDTRDLKAKLKSAKSQIDASKSTLNRMINEPRKEDIPPLKANVSLMEANYKNLKAQLDKMESLTDKRAISKDSLDSKRYEVQSTKAQLEKAKADLNRLLAGAWSYDIQKAKAEYNSSVANAEELQVLLNQAVVRAPRDGEILKIYLREGEYAANSIPNTDPPVLMGTTKQLQIRIDIDEIDASSVKPDKVAVAFLKGNPDKKFKLHFIRIQPFMVPKKNLSSDVTEKVDVRVLQLIYKFDPPKFPVYVGQQVDIYIDNNEK